MGQQNLTRFHRDFIDLFEHEAFKGMLNTSFASVVQFRCEREYISRYKENTQEYLNSVQLLLRLHGLHPGGINILQMPQMFLNPVTITAADMEEVIQIIKDEHPIIPSPSLASLILNKSQYRKELVRIKMELLQQHKTEGDLMRDHEIQEAICLVLVGDRREVLSLFRPYYNLNFFKGRTLLNTCVLYGASSCFDEERTLHPEHINTADQNGTTPLQTSLEFKDGSFTEYRRTYENGSPKIEVFVRPCYNSYTREKREIIALTLLESSSEPRSLDDFIQLFKPICDFSTRYPEEFDISGHKFRGEKIGIFLTEKLLDYLKQTTSADITAWPHAIRLTSHLFPGQPEEDCSLKVTMRPEFILSRIDKNVTKILERAELLERGSQLINSPVIHQNVDAVLVSSHKEEDCKPPDGANDGSCLICEYTGQLESCLTLCLRVDELRTAFLLCTQEPVSLDAHENPGRIECITPLRDTMESLIYLISALCRRLLVCFFTAVNSCDPSKEVSIKIMQSLYRSLIMKQSEFKLLSEDKPLSEYFFSIITGLVDGMYWEAHVVSNIRDSGNRRQHEAALQRENRVLLRGKKKSGNGWCMGFGNGYRNSRASRKRPGPVIGYIERQGTMPDLRHLSRHVILGNLQPGICPFSAVYQLGVPELMAKYLLFMEL